MRHYSVFALTRTASEAISEYTGVAYSAAYPDAGTEVFLGVARTDAEVGMPYTVVTAGYMPIKMADGETLAVGDEVQLDASGQAVAAGVISTGRYVAEIENNYVYLIL